MNGILSKAFGYNNMLILNFTNETGEQTDEKRFLKLLEIACGILDGHDGQVNFVLVDDVVIQKLNKDYRKKDKATDVLSFPYDGGQWPGEEEKVFGEIYISVETALRQAKEKGHDLQRELEILFVHGLLHLMGFDHQNDEEEAKMEGYARRILE